MLPDSVLSSEVVDAPFLFPRNITRRPLRDYEYGGRAIQDPSFGLKDRVWTGDYIDGAVVLAAPGVAPTEVLELANIEQFSFTFDQNMQPFVAYQLENGTAAFYWYDSTAPGFVTTTLTTGSYDPRCSLDDKRPLQTGNSDIILAYCRAGSLYMRVQRDRYETEYELADDIEQRELIQIGMNVRLRFQFQLSTG